MNFFRSLSIPFICFIIVITILFLAFCYIRQRRLANGTIVMRNATTTYPTAIGVQPYAFPPNYNHTHNPAQASYTPQNFVQLPYEPQYPAQAVIGPNYSLNAPALQYPVYSAQMQQNNVDCPPSYSTCGSNSIPKDQPPPKYSEVVK